MQSEEAPVPPSVSSSTEDNTVAIIAYLTILGFIAAIVIHGNKKTVLGAFHLRQALGLVLLSIVGYVAIMILSAILSFIPVLGAIAIGLLWAAFSLALLALVVMGILAAANRKLEPLPIVGTTFQRWFATAFS